MTTQQAILAIAVISAVTAAIRFVPFLFLAGRETPRSIVYLGQVLPCAIMGMLVVYCLRDTRFVSLGSFLPQLIAGAVVVASYVWKRNTLVSIISGTACYMFLVQAVFG